MPNLLPLFYLPPISWFSLFLDTDSTIVLEQHENFPKQTFRNRANIYGANGKLSLIIPTSHHGSRIINQMQISQREKWQALHWKSIKTAYQSSPYFEFYEDQLQTIFSYKTDFLWEFNLNALRTIQEILKVEKTFELSDKYVKNPEMKDYRDYFSPKKETPFLMPDYFQSFSDKYGFLEDLSIIDLLCIKGPESLSYLKSIKLKSI